MASSPFSWPTVMNDGFGFDKVTYQNKTINTSEINTLFGELHTVGVTALLLDLGAIKHVTKMHDNVHVKNQDNSKSETKELRNGDFDNKDTKQNSSNGDEKKANAAVQNINADKTCATKTVFYDLGTGVGTVPLQAFLDADICNIAIDFPSSVYSKVDEMIAQTKPGCTISSYKNLFRCENGYRYLTNISEKIDTSRRHYKTQGSNSGWGLNLFKRKQY